MPSRQREEIAGPTVDTNSPATPAAGSRTSAVAEVHNSAVNEAAALLGGCGQVHLQSGRMCALQNGHEGSCDFTAAENVDALLAEHRAAGDW